MKVTCRGGRSRAARDSGPSCLMLEQCAPRSFCCRLLGLGAPLDAPLVSAPEPQNRPFRSGLLPYQKLFINHLTDFHKGSILALYGSEAHLRTEFQNRQRAAGAALPSIVQSSAAPVPLCTTRRAREKSLPL